MSKNHIELIDSILGGYREVIGEDYPGYRNHVQRMVNFCLALGAFEAETRHKIVIAGAFHDIGIWTAQTFDYLPPSIEAADIYLKREGLTAWSAEIRQMIDQRTQL